MIKGLLIIFIHLFVGEFISWFFDLPVPGNVFGMILMTGSLRTGLVSVKAVKPVADILIGNMAFLFVPPGVGLMLYFGLIEKEIVSIVGALVLSTLLVMAVTAFTQQILEKR